MHAEARGHGRPEVSPPASRLPWGGLRRRGDIPRAEIIRHAVRLVGSLAPSRVQPSLALLGTRPPVPLHHTHTQTLLSGAVVVLLAL
jgi:hypothetical protein